MARLAAGAERSTAPRGDGSGAGPGPSSERAAAAAAGLLDVLQIGALTEMLGQESMHALHLASREACAAVERMATHMVLAAGEAQSDTVAMQRLAGKLPNVHSLTCMSIKDGDAGFREAAGLLGAFAGLPPHATAGVRTVGLGLSSQALGPELSLLLAPFCNLQVRRTSHARGHEWGRNSVPCAQPNPCPTPDIAVHLPHPCTHSVPCPGKRSAQGTEPTPIRPCAVPWVDAQAAPVHTAAAPSLSLLCICPGCPVYKLCT
jgi:hypothetical protein